MNINKSDELNLRNPGRGRSYPRENLGACVIFVEDMINKCGESADYGVLQKAMGVQKRSAVFEKKFSSSRQFGLIEFNKKRVHATTLAKSIIYPASDIDRANALIKAFKLPALYQEIIGKYNKVILPSTLANILYVDFHVAENAKDDAATIFIESAKYSAVLDKDNRLVVELKTLAGEVVKEIDKINIQGDLPERDATSTMRIYKGEVVQEEGQHFKLKFSNGQYAQIFIPDGFTKKDINKLLHQIDVLKFDLDEED